ncbi:MAG: hypothetical protein ACM30E_11055, partial [Nitrososphaerales archaeon]
PPDDDTLGLPHADFRTLGGGSLKPGSQRFLFDAPGTYRIRVQGHLAAHWTDALAGMAISARVGRGKPPCSTLTGTLIDQACLMGVLTALYEMGYTLLDVKRLPDATPVAPASSEAGDRPAAS